MNLPIQIELCKEFGDSLAQQHINGNDLPELIQIKLYESLVLIRDLKATLSKEIVDAVIELLVLDEEPVDIPFLLRDMV